MIVVLQAEQHLGDATTKKYVIDAFADTKEEVVSGATFVDMPQGGQMYPGSSLHTADGEVAFLKSDGTWNWVS